MTFDVSRKNLLPATTSICRMSFNTLRPVFQYLQHPRLRLRHLHKTLRCSSTYVCLPAVTTTTLAPTKSLSTQTSISPEKKQTNTATARSQLIARQFHAFSTSKISTTPLPVSGDRTDSDMSGYNVRKVGAPNTLEHRVYIEKDGVPVSPFHDIPLFANEQRTILNMVVEIPRWTNGKLEVCF